MLPSHKRRTCGCQKAVTVLHLQHYSPHRCHRWLSCGIFYFILEPPNLGSTSIPRPFGPQSVRSRIPRHRAECAAPNLVDAFKNTGGLEHRRHIYLPTHNPNLDIDANTVIGYFGILALAADHNLTGGCTPTWTIFHNLRFPLSPLTKHHPWEQSRKRRFLIIGGDYGV
jgi:hypothetical protein